MRKLLARLELFDLVVFGYAALIAVLILVFHARIPGAGSILAAHAAFAGIAAALIACAEKFPGRGWRIARDWYPVLFVPAAFRELFYLVHPINPADWDATLMAWDRALFGANPTVALEALLHPAAVEALQACYTSYFLLPLLLGLVLYRRDRMASFRESLALVLLAFATSYAIYFLVPARPPVLHELALGHLRRWGLDPATNGFGVASAVRFTLTTMELEMRDCFPSGHTEVVLVILACAWRFHRPTFWAVLAPSLGLVFSTVYLRYHYAVDVVAGAALAALVAAFGPRLFRRWEGWKERGKEGGVVVSGGSSRGPEDVHLPLEN